MVIGYIGVIHTMGTKKRTKCFKPCCDSIFSVEVWII